MLKNISIILQHDCILRPEDLLLVGVSGGPDSLCLLHVLHQIGYPIIAVHVNHKLRPEADTESLTIEELTHQLNIKFISCQADVLRYSQENSVSVEEAARILRYQILFEQAKINRANAVVVGHNADDQVETILMHLLRGTGLAGLKGMEYRICPNPWSEIIPLVRPFLSIPRVEIQMYIYDHALVPISDNSNLDISYFRNRIRHELLPLLEGYNPSIRQAIFRLGQVVKDDYALLQQLTEESWETILIRKGETYLEFKRAEFNVLPPSIQRLILRKAISYHRPGLLDVEFDCIERGLALIAGDKSSTQMDLISGMRLIIENESFWLAAWQADLPTNDFPKVTPGERKVILIPSFNMLNDTWMLEVNIITDPKASYLQSQINTDPYQAWMDIGDLNYPIITRSRAPGDQMRPLGMNGHSIKISDLMINLKLPKRVRATWPLVCSGDEILWVPGFRLSHLVRLNPSTKQAIHMKLFRN
jgi:tRNA(Ile)-lysidine synthase